MTFIASVIAKKGVAIIADSLITSMERVINYDSFLDFFKEKAKSTPIADIKIEPNELIFLFESKPSHTKDYEEKLFQYDQYTAVTTAGSASINNRRIEYLVREVIEYNKKDKNYRRKKIDAKIKDFIEYLNSQAIEHLNKFDYISRTTFIFTHFDNLKEITTIYKIEINFQKYTENIPTVGGVIKVAVIDKEGFKFISGNEILKSENLN